MQIFVLVLCSFGELWVESLETILERAPNDWGFISSRTVSHGTTHSLSGSGEALECKDLALCSERLSSIIFQALEPAKVDHGRKEWK